MIHDGAVPSPSPLPRLEEVLDRLPSEQRARVEHLRFTASDAPVRQTMPTGSAERKNVPLCTGVLDYFPAALAEVAKLSKYGNDKHNPGQPLHWARGKSMDHADCIARHLVDRGITDPDTGLSHTVEVAWRALALLQEELEAAGAPMSRASRVVSPQ
jgi:hypothetical protein